MEKITVHVRALLAKRDAWNQRRLAEAIGATPEQVWRWCRPPGDRQAAIPSTAMVIKVARALGCTMDDVVSISGWRPKATRTRG